MLLSLVSDVATTYFIAPRARRASSRSPRRPWRPSRRPTTSSTASSQEGAASALETACAEAALGQVAAQIPELERAHRRDRRTNSTCCSGAIPRPSRAASRSPTQPLPPEVPAGLPSDAAPAPARRPRRREQQLIAANAAVGRRHRELLPDDQPDRPLRRRRPRARQLLLPGGQDLVDRRRAARAAVPGRPPPQRVRRAPSPVGTGEDAVRADRHGRLRRDDDRPLRSREDRGHGRRAHAPVDLLLAKWCACRRFATTPASRTTSRSSTRCSSSFPRRSRSRVSRLDLLDRLRRHLQGSRRRLEPAARRPNPTWLLAGRGRRRRRRALGRRGSVGAALRPPAASPAPRSIGIATF